MQSGNRFASHQRILGRDIKEDGDEQPEEEQGEDCLLHRGHHPRNHADDLMFPSMILFNVVLLYRCHLTVCPPSVEPDHSSDADAELQIGR